MKALQNAPAPVSAAMGKAPRSAAKALSATPIWWRLFWQLARWAASRTFCTAGKSSPIRMAMMAITTRSSMRVKAVRIRFMVRLRKRRGALLCFHFQREIPAAGGHGHGDEAGFGFPVQLGDRLDGPGGLGFAGQAGKSRLAANDG